MTEDDHSLRRTLARWGVGLAIVAWLTVAACGLWAELAMRGRDRLARQLAARALAANDGGDVRVTINHLEKLGPSAVEPLATLAAAQRGDVAEAAQRGLNRMLARWELAATESGDVAPLAAQATSLAAALDAHAGALGPDGQRWANRLAERLVVHCDQLPAEDAWTILAHCDRVLSRPLSPKQLAAPPSAPAVEAPLAVDGPRPAAPPTASKPVAAVPPPTSVAIVGRPLAELTLVEPVVSPTPQATAKRLPEPFSGERASRTPNDPSAQEQSSGSQPPAVLPTSAVIDVPSPQEARLNRRRLRDLSDRQLAAKVAEPEPAASTAARQALRDRGFSDALLKLTRQLEAMAPAERRNALERASQLPPADARRLLRWFVADEDPEVRLQALTILATTGDPNLADLARERAIEDADPRVAAFAAELMRTR